MSIQIPTPEAEQKIRTEIILGKLPILLRKEVDVNIQDTDSLIYFWKYDRDGTRVKHLWFTLLDCLREYSIIPKWMEVTYGDKVAICVNASALATVKKNIPLFKTRGWSLSHGGKILREEESSELVSHIIAHSFPPLFPRKAALMCLSKIIPQLALQNVVRIEGKPFDRQERDKVTLELLL